MKKLLLFVFTTLLLVGCEGPEGPQGPSGYLNSEIEYFQIRVNEWKLETPANQTDLIRYVAEKNSEFYKSYPRYWEEMYDYERMSATMYFNYNTNSEFQTNLTYKNTFYDQRGYKVEETFDCIYDFYGNINFYATFVGASEMLQPEEIVFRIVYNW